MNKKYIIYSVLMMILMVKPSFAMDNKSDKKGSSSQDQVVAFVVGAVVAAAVTYVTSPINPFVGKAFASLYDDVSPETQEWAKKVFSESGIKNADKIPLKKGKDGQNWSAMGSHFIIVPNDFDSTKCSHQERLESEFCFKHEIKHLQKYDDLKRKALFVGTIALGSLIAQEKLSLTIPIIPVGYGINMAYWKYQESEADRFAYERATSREELEAGKTFFEEYSAKLKHRMTIHDVPKSLNFIEKQIWSGISRKLDNIQSEFSVVSDDPLKIEEFKCKQEQLFDATCFIVDRQHPSLKSRAAMAQDYIDKWDEKHNKQLNTFEMNKRA